MSEAQVVVGEKAAQEPRELERGGAAPFRGPPAPPARPPRVRPPGAPPRPPDHAGAPGGRDGYSPRMAVTVETGTTLAFDRFWRWLKEHANCILRAGTVDANPPHQEAFHWH